MFADRSTTLTGYIALLGLLVASLLAAPAAFATGNAGYQEKHLQKFLPLYTQSVKKFLSEIGSIVATYQHKGADAVNPARLIPLWEHAEIHPAIETQYQPLYSQIWQDLMKLRQALSQGKPVEQVRAAAIQLEHTLWQALGAVKMAAQVQAHSKGADMAHSEATTPAGPHEKVVAIQKKLDQVLRLYKQGQTDQALDLVGNIYAHRFEGIEGALIQRNASLVVEMEKAFNVTLPQLIEKGAPVEKVRAQIEAMQARMEKAEKLLVQAQKTQEDVF